MMGKGLREEYFRYNDYELLYMISQASEEAIDIMYEKYQFLIKKLIKKYNVAYRNRDDYFQEGMMMINKAIRLYNESSKMSFTRYVELLLQRRFIDLYRQSKKNTEQMLSLEEIDYVVPDVTTTSLNETIELSYNEWSEFEKKVFELRINKELPPREIAKILQVEVDSVYSATERVKSKIKRQYKIK